VVGLGAMGSASVYQLARRGVRVIGLDRWAPPHDRGSTHGESRITRQAVAEGDEYVPFVRRSHEIWRELEAETDQSLLAQTGGLFLGRETGTTARHHGQADFVRRTIAVAERHGIAHEVLNAAEIRTRFPQFRLVGDEVGYYEPGAGALRPERCVAAHLARARAHGATVRTGETVLRIGTTGLDVEVTTDVATYTAGAAIVTTGAWLPGLLGAPFDKLLTIHRQVLYWFEPNNLAPFGPARFPVFIWIHGDGDGDYFYGLPLFSDAIKLATEQYVETVHPDRVRRDVSPAEIATMYAAHVRDRMVGVSGRCARTEVCLYTTTPDSRFIVDRHPESERVIVASPCSGHGFKHSAALGEALAELATSGQSQLDVTPFSLARFASS
jgi:sarcosine oxidase